MTKAEQRALAMAEIARERDGVDVIVEVEHREPTYWTFEGERRVLTDGRTVAKLTVIESVWFAHGSIYASWSTGDGLEGRRRTTRYHGRLYGRGRQATGRMISERECGMWCGMLGTRRDS